MFRLVRFELMKMLRKRVSLAVCCGVLALLAGVMALNVVQARTESSAGEVLNGPAAIEARKATVDAHATVLTQERVAEDIAAYREIAFASIDPEELNGLTNAAAYDLMVRTYDAQTVAYLTDPYWSFIFRPWYRSGEMPLQIAARVTDEQAQDFSGGVASLVQAALDDGQAGSWEYTDAERAWWTAVQAEVPQPLAYGYVGGWSNVVDCAAFLVFAMLAVCTVLTPVFASEYQNGTDAVLLAARFGRSKLVAAKILAAFSFATGYFALCASVVCGVSLAFYGADGFWLPVQNIALGIPYPITAGEAALVTVGLMYAATLGMAGLTLLLSSRTRSVLAVFVVGVAVVFLTGLVPSGGNGAVQHLLDVFPLGFSNAHVLFVSMTSYPIGGFVIDLIGAVAFVWTAAALICAPLAARSFRRHQVG